MSLLWRTANFPGSPGGRSQEQPGGELKLKSNKGFLWAGKSFKDFSSIMRRKELGVCILSTEMKRKDFRIRQNNEVGQLGVSHLSENSLNSHLSGVAGVGKLGLFCFAPLWPEMRPNDFSRSLPGTKLLQS